MAGYQAVEWWRAWHGMATDPKWLLVSRSASVTSVTPVTPGHVLAVWVALCERASQSRPRGSIEGFDAEVLAAGLGWDVSLVQVVVDALREKRLIRNDRLAAWSARQPVKVDRTATARKTRQRQRERGEPDPIPPDHTGENVTPCHAVTSTGHAMSRPVTTEREKERSSFALSSFSQDSNSSTPLHIDVCASASDIWHRLEAAGIPVGIVARARNSRTIAGWIENGTTAAQLDAAIKRAVKSREEQNDPAPINVGYIGKCLESVRTGKGRAHGFERGDAAIDNYLASSHRT